GSAHVYRAMKHQSYRFRSDTISLAGPPPHPVTTKDERKARARDYLRALIRTGIKAPPMPGGLVGKFLRSIAPRLNLAQPPVRTHAYRQLRRGVNLSLVLVGLLMAWVVAAPTVFPLMAALYFVVAIAVARPDDVFDQRVPREQPDYEVEFPLPHPARAIVLMVLSVVAPAVLSYLAADGALLLPDWTGRLDGLALPTLVVALPVLGGCALFFVALSRQTRELREFEGSMWGSTQPYELPEVSQGLVRHIYDRLPTAGTLLSWRFDKREEALYAGFLAEADAKLDTGEEASSLAEALSIAWQAPSSRALLKLEALGLLLGLVACVFAWQAAGSGWMDNAPMALALVTASQACMSAAHRLLKRADFVSLVYEADIEATYLPPPTGQIHVGSPRGGRDLHLTSGNVRVRVMRMRSVQFEPGGQRHVTGLELDIGESTRLATAVDDYHAKVLQERTALLQKQRLLQA
ncbi:MAG TPA: hypothetical protein VFM73_09595, partial [Xanthomonadaceae bacterium]|nr:hypothetical protein [Xanthomonadaceae bacterium]